MISTDGDGNLSAPLPRNDGANIDANYALFTTDNNNNNDNNTSSLQSPLPSGLQHAENQNRIGTSAKLDSVRVELSALEGHPYFDNRHVEGFIISKHPCSPSHHLYPQFVDFPVWSCAVASCNTITNSKSSPQSILLSSIDDQTWKEFEVAFSNNLKAGDRNSLLFAFIAVSSTCALLIVSVDKDPLLLFIICLFIFFVIIDTSLPQYLFNKIDSVATKYQTRFAEKGLRISVVYYEVRKGRMTARSRYLVFTALPHPRTLNLV